YAANGTTLTGTSSLFLAPSGNVGIGTTSPYAKLSIQANNSDTNTTLFAIASSTGSATTTLFSVDNAGNTTIGDNTSGRDSLLQFAVNANAWTIGYRSSDQSFAIASATALTGTPAFILTKSGNLGLG